MPFSQQSLDFLVQNQLENSKTWFAEHKADYEEFVLRPMQELVVALTPAMLEIDREFIVEPKIDKTISRIYRDTRFSKDKSLYRSNAWFTFMREKKLYLGMPAYWFEINPTGFGYGMGYYLASPQSMESIRTMALNGDPLFKGAWAAYKSQSIFSLEGEIYKKSKYPDQPEELQDLLNRKSPSFNARSGDIGLLFSDKLAGCLCEGFKMLAPVYKFLCEAEMRKQA